MSATLGSVLGVGAIVGVIAFAFCVIDRGEQRPTRDGYDERIARLGPDPDDGLTWGEWDEEPRPGTGPRRSEEADL